MSGVIGGVVVVVVAGVVVLVVVMVGKREMRMRMWLVMVVSGPTSCPGGQRS